MKTIKLHSLLLPLIVISSTIAPILSMSLPAQADPVISPSIINQTDDTSPSITNQIDETVDFGTLTVNGIWKERQIELKKVDRQSRIVISPAATSPFNLTVNRGPLKTATVTVIVDRNAPVGNHKKVIEIKSGGQTIKKVLLKVRIIPNFPNLPNQPTESKENINNSINPAVLPGKKEKQ
jgi:hypothetical protein